MGIHQESGESFVIPNGQTESNVIEIRKRENLSGLNIFGAAALTNEVTLYTYPLGVDYSDDANRRQQLSGGEPIVIPAGKAVPVTSLLWGAMQLVSAAAEGAARTFPTVYEVERG